ncbi:hypothetical protein [Gibbsiella quercinecans]|uniref:Uncharacterized protein n=1 Tax=Gibbsiella quercinecans TaxID=929813 RepID=A0A250B777_9GAMM|nr:hypothetical protein [Gibbsiella quercinecans]ATA21782.1 hypothetical protein AWC35_21955 [Gibbsiella quercinecans]RLM08254.1 hypothetical protein BIY30_13535 [Gibbsiella quercinecans]RLM12463.1 hypothetical protein BIY27_11990 [Gibbsiella quercinecans]
MDSPKQIADGMLKLLENRRKGNSEIFFHSAAKGFMDIPGDLWALTRDFFDTDNQWRNQTDKIRLMNLIKKGVTSDDIRRLINIVIRKYLSGLSEEQSKKLLIKIAGNQMGSFAFKAIFVNELIALFATRIIPKFLVSAGITGILSIGASVSRSIYASYELKDINQSVYNELRAAGDLDLMYFMLEEYINPYLHAIKYQGVNNVIDQQIFDNLLAGVNRAQ